MGCIIMTPVDMLMQPSQHHTPGTVSWKFGLQAHQQCTIKDHPYKVLEMTHVIHIQQGQGVGHASLLKPMPSLGAPVHGEAEYLVCNDDLLIDLPLLLDLVIDVKQFIQCKKEHLWPVAISHYSRHLEGRDARVPSPKDPALPESLHGLGEGPPGMQGEHCFKPAGNK